MEAGDQLAFRLGQIERQSVSLGDAGDQKDDEAEELRADVPQAALCLDYVAKIERACQQDDAEQREAHEHLVA